MLCQSHGENRRAGLAAEDLGGFSHGRSVRCLGPLGFFRGGHTASLLGNGVWQNQGGNRKRSSWMDLFVSLDNTIPTLSDPSNSLFLSLSKTFVTRALLSCLFDIYFSSVDKCRRSTGRGGQVGKASDVFMVSGQDLLYPQTALPASLLQPVK